MAVWYQLFCVPQAGQFVSTALTKLCRLARCMFECAPPSSPPAGLFAGRMHHLHLDHHQVCLCNPAFVILPGEGAAAVHLVATLITERSVQCIPEYPSCFVFSVFFLSLLPFVMGARCYLRRLPCPAEAPHSVHVPTLHGLPRHRRGGRGRGRVGACSRGATPAAPTGLWARANPVIVLLKTCRSPNRQRRAAAFGRVAAAAAARCSR